tara:strand:+ start:302 stop:1018 length:717 start_codon:yes stop_codon:yes gene_type:complete
VNNVNEIDEKLFKRRRTALYSICILIFLLDANLSIFLDKIFKHGFSSEQMDSLIGILFVALIITLIRYHHTVVASKAWSKMIQEFHPYRRKELHINNVLLDNTSYGQSEYDLQYWITAESDETSRIPYYTLEEDVNFKSSTLRTTNQDHKMKRGEFWLVKIRILIANILAWIKFSIDHSGVFDVLIPYLFFILTFVEITGLLKISAYLESFGNFLNTGSLISIMQKSVSPSLALFDRA